MVQFDEIWERIEKHAGETFVQIRGEKFTYSVKKSQVVPDRTNRNLPKSDFRKASAMLPLKNTVPVQQLQGPSYIYAILMDNRIRQRDW